MRIDAGDILLCPDCAGEFVEALTSRKSKGQTVKVRLEVDEIVPDLLSLDVAHQWVLSKVGTKLHAGQPGTKNQRAGMLANGIGFHAEHAPVCNKRRATRRR